MDDMEQAIGRDLETIAIIEAFGDRKAKAAARRQRKAIFAEIKAMNRRDGLDKIMDDELAAELAEPNPSHTEQDR